MKIAVASNALLSINSNLNCVDIMIISIINRMSIVMYSHYQQMKWVLLNLDATKSIQDCKKVDYNILVVVKFVNVQQ